MSGYGRFCALFAEVTASADRMALAVQQTGQLPADVAVAPVIRM